MTGLPKVLAISLLVLTLCGACSSDGGGETWQIGSKAQFCDDWAAAQDDFAAIEGSNRDDFVKLRELYGSITYPVALGEEVVALRTSMNFFVEHLAGVTSKDEIGQVFAAADANPAVLAGSRAPATIAAYATKRC